MFSTQTDNPNYLVRIVRIPEVRPHPNADKLNLTTVQHQTIIVGRETQPGELYVLFQLGTEINPEFLAFINGFADKEKNDDKERRGFFNKPYVKAVRLRGIVSEGYLHPVADFNAFLKSRKLSARLTEECVDQEFDTVEEKSASLWIAKKYVPPVKNPGGPNIPRGKIKRESRIVDGQFRLSPDYRHLKREIHTISPNDWIEISAKYHGANAVISRILTKRNLTARDKIARFFGAKIQETEPGLVFSSRRCIKSEEYRDFQAADFYGENLWAAIAKKYQDCLKPGITCYGELVGFTSGGAPIQSIAGKPYDYGCEPKTCDFFVFRITFTNESGDVFEFSAPQVVSYCQRIGLKHVPFYYIGYARDKYPDLDPENHWHENFLEKLSAEFLEKDDVFCRTPGLFDEGIVLSKRIDGFEGLKLKSQKFLLGESADLEKGVPNLEDVAG